MIDLIAAAVLASARPEASHCHKTHAYHVLERARDWEGHGNNFAVSFYAGGSCGLTSTYGGFGRPHTHELYLRGVQAGDGRLIVRYHFGSHPHRIWVNTGDDRFYAYRR